MPLPYTWYFLLSGGSPKSVTFLVSLLLPLTHFFPQMWSELFYWRAWKKVVCMCILVPFSLSLSLYLSNAGDFKIT